VTVRSSLVGVVKVFEEVDGVDLSGERAGPEELDEPLLSADQPGGVALGRGNAVGRGGTRAGAARLR